ncbi:MAG: single-stranded DNA-binding protein [Oscillospiraceae bacterium]|jgi:single-strand DNA-binding protein|nr:single-stranded DNA-binding protein [Oscillospiraceae bacterium]
MLNVIALVGRLVADPELRRTPNDVPVVRFSVAVPRSYVRQGEERQTDFFDVVSWRGAAEFICNYFKKGNLIGIDGSIQTRTYVGADGIKRKVFEIIANNIHFVESKAASQESSSSGSPSNEVYSNGNESDFNSRTNDDDLPF